MKGTIEKFNASRGFGFIQPDGGGKDVFVHISELPNRQAPKVGQRLTFDVKQTPKGTAATNVRLTGQQQAQPTRNQPQQRRQTKQSMPSLGKQMRRMSPYKLFGGIAAVAVIGVVGYLFFADSASPTVAYLTAINIVTFLMYGYDKLSAQSNMLRVPEWVLHGVALAGGTPGAFAGQRTFRHKTRKQPFQVIFLGIAAVQSAIVAYTTNLF